MHSSAEKTVRLGRGQLEVSFPKSTTVIEPRFIQGLPEEKSAIVRALRHPIQSPPLAEWIKLDSTICVLFTDIVSLGRPGRALAKITAGTPVPHDATYT